MTQPLTARITTWIRTKREEAKKARDEADIARAESGYSDIDALEQFSFNEGVLDTLEELEGLLDT